MALAGFGLTSCRRPEMHLVPFTKSVEWTIPGKALYYATAMPRRTGAHSLDRRDGRRTSDQTGRQSASSGERRGDRCVRAGLAPRSLRSGALETFRRQKEKRREREEGRAFETRDRAAFEKYLARTPDEDRRGRRRRARFSRRGAPFADARTFARRAPEDLSENAVVRLRSAPDRGAKFRDPVEFRG